MAEKALIFHLNEFHAFVDLPIPKEVFDAMPVGSCHRLPTGEWWQRKYRKNMTIASYNITEHEVPKEVRMLALLLS